MVASFPTKTCSPIAIGILACFAALVLHGYPIAHPFLFDDDFAIIRGSLTWSDTIANLWRPWNEHAMPLGRLSTWLIVQTAGVPSHLPFVASLQGPLAVLAAMWLVYLFVSRELGHGFYGVVAMIVFGVTLKYNEAVLWFAASFAVLALDTTLMALLAAQRWRQEGNPRHLALCVLWCALAPAWFASGVLAGLFCSIYLISGQSRGCRHRLACLAPLVGTGLFLSVSLAQNYHAIQNAAHYQGQTASQAFQPLAGVQLTARIIVDNLVMGFGAFGSTCPMTFVGPLLGVIVGISTWWALQAVRNGTRPSFVYLAFALLFVSYILTYSFRAAWPYEEMMVRWTRYNLFPFLGLVLLLCAGLPSRQGTLFQLTTNRNRLTVSQAIALSLLVGVLLLLQLPLGIAGNRARDAAQAEQMTCLREIDRIDALCRAHGISPEAAREALGTLRIPYSGDPDPRINGWDFLSGSSNPRQIGNDEAHELLKP